MLDRHDAPDHNSRIAITVVGVALVVILACSIPSTWRITQRFVPSKKPRYQPLDERYRDEDGIATPESEAAYSYQIQRVLVLVLSAIGAVDSLILSIVASGRPDRILAVPQWLQFGGWVCVLNASEEEAFFIN